MTTFADAKSDHCIAFILDQITLQDAKYKQEGDEGPRVLFVGLNGLQGVGKTTLVSG